MPKPTFAAILTRLRTEAGLSREQLAKTVGVTRQMVGKWETGENVPNWTAIQKIADALRVPTEDLRDK